MTDKRKFFKTLEAKGFTVSDNFFAIAPVTPRHRKTPEGHHNIINNITVVDMGGSNVKEGDLGCVTFTCFGVERRKFHEPNRHGTESEVIKKAFCPKTAKEAIKAYTEWAEQSQKTMNSWELVI